MKSILFVCFETIKGELFFLFYLLILSFLKACDCRPMQNDHNMIRDNSSYWNVRRIVPSWLFYALFFAGWMIVGFWMGLIGWIEKNSSSLFPGINDWRTICKAKGRLIVRHEFPVVMVRRWIVFAFLVDDSKMWLCGLLSSLRITCGEETWFIFKKLMPATSNKPGRHQRYLRKLGVGIGFTMINSRQNLSEVKGRLT